MKILIKVSVLCRFSHVQSVISTFLHGCNFLKIPQNSHFTTPIGAKMSKYGNKCDRKYLNMETNLTANGGFYYYYNPTESLATTTIAFLTTTKWAGNYHTGKTGPESFTSKLLASVFYVGTFSKGLCIISIGKWYQFQYNLMDTWSHFLRTGTVLYGKFTIYSVQVQKSKERK